VYSKIKKQQQQRFAAAASGIGCALLPSAFPQSSLRPMHQHGVARGPGSASAILCGRRREDGGLNSEAQVARGGHSLIIGVMLRPAPGLTSSLNDRAVPCMPSRRERTLASVAGAGSSMQSIPGSLLNRPFVAEMEWAKGAAISSHAEQNAEVRLKINTCERSFP
jgi:hypothetical protein